MNINIEELFICNLGDKKNQEFSDHCRNQCLHSRFHYKNECTQEEFCSLHEFGSILKVKCRKIKKKEIKALQEVINCGRSIVEFVYIN